MNRQQRVFVALIAIVFLSPAMANERSLSNVLGEIDKALRGTRGVTATVTITKVVSGKDETVSSGKFYANQDDVVRIDFDSPAARTALIGPDRYYDYSPTAKTADQWSLSNAPEGEQRFLNLGFGDKGTDLSNDYTISLLESASWNTRQTTVLALTPKRDYRRSQAWSIVLRLDELTWLPVEQTIHYGDSQTALHVVYTNMAKDNNLPSKTFKPSWPSGTKKSAH